MPARFWRRDSRVPDHKLQFRRLITVSGVRVTKELVLVRDVLDCHVQVRGVEGGYGADPGALERVGGGVVPPAEGDPAAGAALELVDALEPAEVPLLLLHAAIVAAAAATAMATMTGFGKRRMRLIS
jgi:hypothetical protein